MAAAGDAELRGAGPAGGGAARRGRRTATAVLRLLRQRGRPVAAAGLLGEQPAVPRPRASRGRATRPGARPAAASTRARAVCELAAQPRRAGPGAAQRQRAGRGAAGVRPRRVDAGVRPRDPPTARSDARRRRAATDDGAGALHRGRRAGPDRHRVVVTTRCHRGPVARSHTRRRRCCEGRAGRRAHRRARRARRDTRGAGVHGGRRARASPVAPAARGRDRADPARPRSAGRRRRRPRRRGPHRGADRAAAALVDALSATLSLDRLQKIACLVDEATRLRAPSGER